MRRSWSTYWSVSWASWKSFKRLPSVRWKRLSASMSACMMSSIRRHSVFTSLVAAMRPTLTRWSCFQLSLRSRFLKENSEGGADSFLAPDPPRFENALQGGALHVALDSSVGAFWEGGDISQGLVQAVHLGLCLEGLQPGPLKLFHQLLVLVCQQLSFLSDPAELTCAPHIAWCCLPSAGTSARSPRLRAILLQEARQMLRNQGGQSLR
mmetsp:Transcript_30447/g.72447  ORF Transcript_30447/g.72447 Transcript_30447/m.72447 type:complete len:209 (+) Transcript_30447:799-1425(+)